MYNRPHPLKWWFLLTVSFITCTAGAQVALDRVVVHPVTEYSAPRVARGVDGATTILYTTGGNIGLSRFQTSGQLEWSKEITTSFEWMFHDVSQGSSGGCYVGGIGNPEFATVVPWDPDTAWFDLQLAFIDASGNIGWQTTIRRTWISMLGPYLIPTGIRLQTMADGSLLMAVQFANSSLDGMDILHFSDSGSLLWSRAYGNAADPNSQPNLGNNDFLVPIPLHVNAAGNIGLAHCGTSMNSFKAAMLDPNGDVLQGSSLTYNTASAIIYVNDLQVSSAGEITLNPIILTLPGALETIVKIPIGGSTVSARGIALEQGHLNGRLFVDTNNTAFVLTRPVSDFTSLNTQLLLEIPTVGNTAVMHERRLVIDGTEHQYMIWHELAYRSDELTLGGWYAERDTVFNTKTLYPAYTQYDASDISACYWKDSTLSIYDFPSGLLTIEPDTTIRSIPNDSAFAVLQGPLITISAPFFPTVLDGCQIPTTIMEATQQPIPGPQLLNTLIARGSFLDVLNVPFGTMRILDASGALVTQLGTRRVERASFQTDQLVAGVYVLVITDLDRQRSWAMRFAVE